MNTGSTQGPPQHNEPNTCMYTGTLPLDLDWPTRARTELGYYVSSQEKEPESQSGAGSFENVNDTTHELEL